MWKQFLVHGEPEMRKTCMVCGLYDHKKLNKIITCITKTCQCPCNEGRY